MGKRITPLNKIKIKFGDKFDYSKLREDVKFSDQVEIGCPEHGFYTTTVKKHFCSKTGCPECGKIVCAKANSYSNERYLLEFNQRNPDSELKILSKFEGAKVRILVKNKYGVCSCDPIDILRGGNPTILTAIDKTGYVINQFIEKHGDRYIYDKFKYEENRIKSIIECILHGEFKTSPNQHIAGQGCPKCGNEKIAEKLRSTTAEFVEKAELIHNKKYDYSDSIYESAVKKLEIRCKVENHGTFWQIPNSHLAGNGCPKCGFETGGYSRGDYVRWSKGREGILYIIKCKKDTEEFYKIGITTHSVNKRFSNSLPYDYEIIYEYKCDAGCVWDLEKEYHKKYKEYSYTPQIFFKGSTECFINLPLQTIFKELDEK